MPKTFGDIMPPRPNKAGEYGGKHDEIGRGNKTTHGPHPLSTGSSLCRDASEFVEEALGERGQERMTSEFYQAPSVTQVVRQPS